MQKLFDKKPTTIAASIAIIALAFAAVCYAQDCVLAFDLALILAAVSLVSLCVLWWRGHHSAQQRDCENDGKEKAQSIVVVVALILVTTLPMSLCPIWNGEIPDHRNQYELLAQSLLKGSIALDFEIDPAFEALENPYDPEARQAAGATFHHDSAYYNGTYYMYFGIVPVVLVFLPYQALFGTPLTTYHATQIFAALFIIGLFLFLRQARSQYFPKLPKSDFFLLLSSISLISMWYISTSPALYCTAICSGVCMEIWSLYFFTKAVWKEKKQNRQIGYASLGSLFGAFAVGCRPPVAIANLLVIPLLIRYLHDNTVNAKLIGKLVLAALPYVVVLGLLFYYNYVRFDDFLEFGQSYQITVADQHEYADVVTRIMESNVLGQIVQSFVSLERDSMFVFAGMFIEYPLLLLTFLGFSKASWSYLADKKIAIFFVSAIIVSLLIIAVQAIAAPWPLEEYKADELWLLGIGAFFAYAATAQSWKPSSLKGAATALRILTVTAILVSVFLFFVPNDSNFTAYYWGEDLTFIFGKVYGW